MFNWITSVVNWAVGIVPTPIRTWIHDLVGGVFGFIHTVFNLVGRAWHDFYVGVQAIANGIARFTSAVADRFHYILYIWIPEIIRWITTHILDPLLRVLKWIAHQGEILWYYLTHPAKLVDLIWDDVIVKLEREAWNVGKKLGGFFLSLIIHNIGRVANLLEDIIHAVL